MKGAFLVIARNKAKWVRYAAMSMLAQTHSPLEIVFSDQGSTDGTREILEECMRSYNGPNKVRLIDCPHLEAKGMMGCNTHLDWAHSQIDADVIMMMSADDRAHPERAAKTMAAYEEHKPDMVLTKQAYVKPDGTVRGHSLGPDEERWCVPNDCFELLVGGSSSQSYTKEFAEAVGPLSAQVCGQDVVMPLLATLRKGAYYLCEVLHDFYEHVDEVNTGLGGQMLAAKNNREKQLQLEEIMHFQGASNLYFVASVMEKWGIQNHPAAQLIAQNIIDRAASWQKIRGQLTLAKVPPLPMAA